MLITLTFHDTHAEAKVFNAGKWEPSLTVRFTHPVTAREDAEQFRRDMYNRV